MNDQLQLVDGPQQRPWRLDARTRAAGRRGVAQARQALRQAVERQDPPPADEAPTRAA